jgi:hypothetical protein
MSKHHPKTFSTMMSNIDQNTYRALKIMLDESKKKPINIGRNNQMTNRDNTPFITRRSLEMPNKNNNNNMWKYPFGLKEKRFKWQTDKVINEGRTIQGSLKTYYHKQTSTRTSWDGLNNVNSDCFPQFKSKEQLERYSI